MDVQLASTVPPATSIPVFESILAGKLADNVPVNDEEASKRPRGIMLAHPAGVRTPTKSPSKTRSLSDSAPKLSPSPKFKERFKISRDDQSIQQIPKTPRQFDGIARGLSLQMPAKQQTIPPSLHPLGPLSPKIDQRSTYGSPTSVLPRHSRGLDFARACTNLHHSTLAEASSPDSSPTVNQKAISIPSRAGMPPGYMILDTPQMYNSTWGHAASDRGFPTGSLSSVTMVETSDSDSDERGSIEPDDAEDAMISTPQATRSTDASASTPFPVSSGISTKPLWPTKESPGPSSFMKFQRARLRPRRSRQSSSSASGHSSLASPAPQSPPNGRADAVNSYFARELSIKKNASRRESLSLGTRDLHISSGNDSGEEAGLSGMSTPGVVQRPVTRRGNLLPKSRAFGRIRAELMEESAPVDTEVKREAEVIRQVRESDQTIEPSAPGVASSPMLPASESMLEGIPEDNPMGIEMPGPQKNLFGQFSRQALRNSISGGKDFWNTFDKDIRTPPPPFFTHRNSDDMAMDSPNTASSTPSTTVFATTSANISHESSKDSALLPSRSSTPHLPSGPSAADGIRKANKRRRDDDLDGLSMKRRAVSPGMSVHNSPVLSQSPNQREVNLWGQPASTGGTNAAGTATPGATVAASGQLPSKMSRESSVAAVERSNSTGSTTAVPPAFGHMAKRVGMQGMTDTNDGLMKMSIE